jgi:lysozyme family protein
VTDEQILDGVLRREGGYVDDKADKGRCTNRGITLDTLREWRGPSATCEDVRNLSEFEARAIYRSRYLKPFDGLDAAIKPQVVDIAVNSGVLRAKALLAIAQQSGKPLNTALVIERLNHYARLVAADPTQARFFKGWVSRALEFLV